MVAMNFVISTHMSFFSFPSRSHNRLKLNNAMNCISNINLVKLLKKFAEIRYK